MAQEDVYKLARYLQDHAGAQKSDDWYAQVINGNQSQSVILPRSVPLAIGK